MVNTEIRLIMFFAAKDGEALRVPRITLLQLSYVVNVIYFLKMFSHRGFIEAWLHAGYCKKQHS